MSSKSIEERVQGMELGLEAQDNPWAQQQNSKASTSPQSQPQSGSSTPTSLLPSMVLLVFIHGFKGSADTTFLDFPSRLSHILRETYTGLIVESQIYPTYDTRGSLASAVSNFVEWLTEQVVKLESKPLIDEEGNIVPPGKSGRGAGAGSVSVICCGHSMGGLVALDAALEISASGGLGEKNQLWPRVCGVIAYDTPYYGVHPNVFKNSLTKYGSYLKTASDVGTHLLPIGGVLAARFGLGGGSSNTASGASAPSPDAERSAPASSPTQSSGWGSLFSKAVASPSATSPPSSSSSTPASNQQASSNWRTALMGAGALALAGGAAAGYVHRDKIGGMYGWTNDHLLFVSNLWDTQAQRKRLDSLVALPQVLFHCYYTRLPAKPAQGTKERTFVVLPSKSARSAGSFTACDNRKATDEVEAHIGMFSSKENSSFYDLGLRSSALIGLILENEQQFSDQVRSQAETEEIPEDEGGLRDGDPDLVRAQKVDQEIRKKAEAEIAKETSDNSTTTPADEKGANESINEENLTNSGRPRRKVGNYRNQAPSTPEPPRDEHGNEPVVSKGEHFRYASQNADSDEVEVDERF